MQQPLDQFSPEEINKNSIIALYANEDLDNKGLPFFLGKVLCVFNKNEKMMMTTTTKDRVTRRLPNM